MARHHLELHGRSEELRGRKQSKADEPAPELSNSQTAETSPAWYMFELVLDDFGITKTVFIEEFGSHQHFMKLLLTLGLVFSFPSKNVFLLHCFD